MCTHAFVNDSGSAGKTTSSVSLGALLAERSKRVLLIDCDPQGNATLFAGAKAVPGKTMAEVLLGERSLDEVVVGSAVANLWIAPAMRSLNAAVVGLTRDFGGEQKIRVALASLHETYDAVLIDCPGSANVLSVAALVAADHALAVAQPTLKELEGLPALEETIAKVSSLYNPALRLSAVIPCIVPPSTSGRLYADGLTQLRELYGQLVTSPIRRSVRVPEAYSSRLPLPTFAPLEPASYDYQIVLEELLSRGVLP
jgi:chromosome partitioning protein